MSRKSDLLRKKERMEITLPTLVEYFASSRQIKGCSPKTLIATRGNLGKFMRFLKGRGHSLGSVTCRSRMLAPTLLIFKAR